ncbi:MAG: DUF3579 domain-containing protein [Gammaproteobacteria bacterium]|nr:DUF3579 domain-containing protein [Gammaproteobacteria bacterium]
MDKIIIEGVTEEGKTFRPSAWAEMVSSNLASFGRDNKLKYDRGVHPCVINGVKCIVVARELQDDDPHAYEYVMQFARQNNLRVQRDKRQGDRALHYPG